MMRARFVIAFCLVAASVGCRGKSTMQRGEQQYDVVQEGSTTAASTTVGAPGESGNVAMTGTNADTTTNFTLSNPSPMGSTDTTGGSVASSMPAYPAGTPMPSTMPSTTRTARPAQPRVVLSAPAPTLPPVRTTTTARTDTMEQPAAQTDTTAPMASSSTMTDTQAPPPPNDEGHAKKKDKEKDKDQQHDDGNQPPPADDQQEQPPPPPPPNPPGD